MSKHARMIATTLWVAAVATPAAQSPTFDVVSIRQNTSGTLPNSPVEDRPDGGFRMSNQPVLYLIGRAFPAFLNREGAPDWVTRDRYDVVATAALTNPSREDRSAMFRAMLADRFKLTTHVESREMPVYELVLARKDGRLGPGLKPSDTDCDKILAEREASGARVTAPRDLKDPLPPCYLLTVGATLRDMRGDGLGRMGDLMQGDAPMKLLAAALRPLTRRDVIDNTGLAGSYRITLNFDMLGVVRGPDSSAPSNGGPLVFTAVQEQLGLKLEAAKHSVDVLVIDHIERPSTD